MALTTTARNAIATYLGGAITHIGVGDSTDAFDAADTDLQAATNKDRNAVDGANDVTVNVITAEATFIDGEAEWAWAEWGTFSAGAGGTMFNRKVQALGTKGADSIWVITATLTITVS